MTYDREDLIRGGKKQPFPYSFRGSGYIAKTYNNDFICKVVFKVGGETYKGWVHVSDLIAMLKKEKSIASIVPKPPKSWYKP